MRKYLRSVHVVCTALALVPTIAVAGSTSLTFETETLAITPDEVGTGACVQVGIFMTYEGPDAGWEQIGIALDYTAPEGLLSGAPLANLSDMTSTPEVGLTNPPSPLVTDDGGGAPTPCDDDDILNSLALGGGFEAIPMLAGNNASGFLVENVNAGEGSIFMSRLGASDLFTTEDGARELVAIVEFPIGATPEAGSIEIEFDRSPAANFLNDSQSGSLEASAFVDGAIEISELLFAAESFEVDVAELERASCLQVGVFASASAAQTWRELVSSLRYTASPAGLFTGAPFVRASGYTVPAEPGLTSPGTPLENGDGTSTPCAPADIVNSRTAAGGAEDIDFLVGIGVEASTVNEDVTGNAVAGEVDLDTVALEDLFVLPAGELALVGIVEFEMPPDPPAGELRFEFRDDAVIDNFLADVDSVDLPALRGGTVRFVDSSIFSDDFEDMSADAWTSAVGL